MPGAISCFSTLTEPQTEQDTKPRLRLLVIGGAVAEPAIEGVALVAYEVIVDHAV